MKATKSIIIKTTISLGILLIIRAQAYASYLQINGNPNLSLSIEGDSVHISGTYEIENKGDETAQNVFPSFTIAGWLWAGEPKTINANQKGEWTIDESFSIDKLSCEKDIFCDEVELPLAGVFPVRVQRHYEDTNGYPFTAPGIIHLITKDLPQAQRSIIQVKNLLAMTDITGNGKEFEGKLVINNVSPNDKVVSVAYYSSRELKTLTKTSHISIASNGTKTLKYALENFSGRAGSSYPVFAILQWEEAGVRNSLSVSNIAQIEKPEESNKYLYIAGAVLGMCALGLYLAVFRRRT